MSLTVAPGIHTQTGKKGYFAFDRDLLGSFPICWKPTKEEAVAYAKEFTKKRSK